MRSKRTRRLNKKYRRSQKIGKKTKRGKKKRSKRVRKIIHKGGMYSGILAGGPRPVVPQDNSRRADAKASDSKDDSFAGRRREEKYEKTGNSSGELTSWEEGEAAAVKGTGSQVSGVLSDPHLKASLGELEYVRPEGEQKSRFNDINKCYPKTSWSYECGEHPNAINPLYMSSFLSKFNITTPPKNWSEYEFPVTDMENGKEYCCNEP